MRLAAHAVLVELEDFAKDGLLLRIGYELVAHHSHP